jgi:hypothetical protein
VLLGITGIVGSLAYASWAIVDQIVSRRAEIAGASAATDYHRADRRPSTPGDAAIAPSFAASRTD